LKPKVLTQNGRDGFTRLRCTTARQARTVQAIEVNRPYLSLDEI
jgi:hypothetical protein